MQIREIETGTGSTVVELEGMLVLGREGQRVEWAVENLVKDGKNKIILDLTKVPYVDSAGVGILVGCLGHCRQGGGEMRLVGVDERLMRIMKITNVDKVLAIDASRDEAQQKLGVA